MAQSTPTKGNPKKQDRKSVVQEYVEAILIAVILALFLRTFVIQAFKIPSESMMDTLLVGDYLLVNKFVYGTKIPFTDTYLWKFKEPERGDVIVFKYPLDKGRDFIKRCVAVEGDTLLIEDNILKINGNYASEPYKTLRGASRRDMANFGPKIVPDGHLFMMGDNRNNSSDSRVWGPLQKDLIKGKAILLYFSWDPEKHRPRIERIGRGIY